MTRAIDDEVLRRQAYLDEELSVDEVIAFEATLTRPQRAALEAELRFERALGERLAQGTDCPDQLWQRLQSELAASRTAPAAPTTPTGTVVMMAPSAAQLQAAATVTVAPPALAPRRRGWQLLTRRARPWWLATAALIAILGVLIALRPVGPEITFSNDLTAFARNARYAGDYEKVGRELSNMHINVNFRAPTAPAKHGHELQLLGMTTMERGSTCCAVLYFNCCGQPVAVVVANAGCKMIGCVRCTNLPAKSYTVRTTIDQVQVMGVGPHDPVEVLDLFS